MLLTTTYSEGVAMVESADKLPLKEVARQLGRSLEQVRRYVREGKLPAQKLGMQWFVERRALEAFKSANGRVVKEDVLARARALRERIRARVGQMDVVELLEESRRSRDFELSPMGGTQDQPFDQGQDRP
jgi:excisionase family DNA binding protein